MNIAEIRQKYPQYNDLSDEELAKGLHKKFYSDMDFGEFSNKIGLTPQKSQTQTNVEGALASLDRGLTFGLSKKIGGALNALGAAPVDMIAGGKSLKDAFRDRYNEIVQTADESQKDFANRNPVTAASLEIGGAIANPVNKVAVGFLPKNVGLGKKILGSSVVGSGISALDSEINGNEEELKDALTVGGVSAAMPVLGTALKGISKVGSQALGISTGAGEKAVADAFKAGQKGDYSFLEKMRSPIDAEKLESKIKQNFNKIKQNRNRAYEEDLTRIKQQTADKPLNLKAVIDDVKAIIKNEGGGAEYLVDDDTARVLDKTKDTLNKFYKDKSRHNLEGFDNLKKKLQDVVNTKEGTNADRVKTQITNAVRNQILKQSPEYKAVQDAYARDSEIIDDLKKVFSLNRNANSETILKKVQSTARNNANTDWGYRAELLKRIDPTGEIQEAISANALNEVMPRGLVARGLGGIGIYSHNPLMALSSSPRLVGEAAYKLGEKSAKARSITPEIAQMLRLINNGD
jgi:hypothetical protein